MCNYRRSQPSEWNIGAILSYDPSAVNAVNTLIGGVPGFSPSISQRPGGAQSIPAVANVWEVVLSNHMSSLDWGVGVMYGWSNNDLNSNSPTTSFNREASSNVWGFRAGLVAPFGSGNSFDASAAVRLDKATDKMSSTPLAAATTGDYSASGTEFHVNLRAKFNCSPKFNFVPYGTLLSISAEPKEDTPPSGVATAPTGVKASALAYAVGAGGEYRSQGFYFAGGLSYTSARVKSEVTPPGGGGTTTTTLTSSAIPVLNLGGEWWFIDWLAGRAGYYRSLGKLNVKSEPPSGGTTTEVNIYNPNSSIAIGSLNAGNYDGLVTFGVGMKFGGFALDATVSEEALRRGLGLVGASDNINSFGYITTSYNFGE